MDNYFPILIQVLVAAGFVVTTLVATHYLGPKVKNKHKDENFECGIEEQGNARFPFSVKYFMTAILFVLFDVEVIFFYPYAVNFKNMQQSGAGLEAFVAVLIFVFIFLCGFYYVKRKGALDWER